VIAGSAILPHTIRNLALQFLFIKSDLYVIAEIDEHYILLFIRCRIETKEEQLERASIFLCSPTSDTSHIPLSPRTKIENNHPQASVGIILPVAKHESHFLELLTNTLKIAHGNFIKPGIIHRQSEKKIPSLIEEVLSDALVELRRECKPFNLDVRMTDLNSQFIGLLDLMRLLYTVKP